jgi:lipopolysaccharide exporter
MRLLLNLSKHFDFVRNVATMMSGRSIAAGIALVTMPIVARLYDPGDFGVAAVFLSLIGMISTFSALRYDAAVVLPEDDEEALDLAAVGFRILFLISLVLVAMLLAYTWSGANWRILELLGVWKWLLPLGVLLTTALHIQEAWLARKKRFQVVAATLVVGSVTNSGTRIGLGTFAGSSVLGLIAGNILGMSFRLLLQNSMSSEVFRAVFRRMAWRRTRQITSRYADFPKLNAPAAMVFTFGQNLPVLLMGLMFTPAVAGFYAMADRLSQAPVTIVTNSVRRVFLQKVADTFNRGKSLRKAFLLATGGLALLGIVPFGCVWIYGQPLLTWLLGVQWFEAGRYLEIMAPWLFMAWLTAPANPIFVVLRKQSSWLTLQTIMTVLRLVAFGVAFAIGADSEWTLQAFVIATIFGHLLTIAVASMRISEHAKVLLANKPVNTGGENGGKLERD